jgi:F-type H+-transporting ATPase subunit a
MLKKTLVKNFTFRQLLPHFSGLGFLGVVSPPAEEACRLNSMHSLRMFLVAVFFAVAAYCAHAADPATPAPGAGVAGTAVEAATPHGDAAEGEAHGLPPNAVKLRANGFVSNSMVVTWIVAAFLIVFARRAMKNVQEVPSGAQNFWEWMVESLYGFLEGIVGSELVKKTFWFFATIFIFILFANWAGLIPGVGTIGWGTTDAAGHFHVKTPLLRGVNADLNMTLAMAIIFFACWIVWAIQANGVGGFILHIFGPKGDTTGALKILMIFIFIVVGVLEVVTILFPAGDPQLPPLWEYFRRREHVGSDGENCPGVRLADPDSLLLPRTAGGFGAGAGLHAFDRRLHLIDLHPRRRRSRACAGSRAWPGPG